MANPMNRQRRNLRRLIIGAVVAAVAFSMVPGSAGARRFSKPTYSSPITLSRDGKFLWVVNPGADSVSVIYTKTNKVIKRIKVGDEPQSVAVDPNNRYAYVANAAAGSVTVIRITRASGKRFRAKRYRPAGQRGAIVTGAEPWNIVISPNG